MPLPKTSHLQYVILSELLHGDSPGHELRDRLNAQQAGKSRVAFYQLMARLEDSGLVSGWDETTRIDGTTIRSRCYKITGSGRKAVEAQEEFYVSCRQARLGTQH